MFNTSNTEFHGPRKWLIQADDRGKQLAVCHQTWHSLPLIAWTNVLFGPSGVSEWPCHLSTGEDDDDMFWDYLPRQWSLAGSFHTQMRGGMPGTISGPRLWGKRTRMLRKPQQHWHNFAFHWSNSLHNRRQSVPLATRAGNESPVIQIIYNRAWCPH